MAINWRVPASAKGLDLSQAVNGYLAGNQSARRNRLLEINEQSNDRQQQTHDEEFSNRSIVKGALQLLPYLQSQDVDGGRSALEGRIQEIDSRGGDSSDTQEVLGLWNQGNFGEVGNQVQSALTFGERMGYIKPSASGQAPTNIERLQTYLGGMAEDDPRRPAVVAAIDNLGRDTAGVSVNVHDKSTQAGLTAEQKALATNRASRFEKIQGEADNALDQLEGLEQMRNIDVQTGWGMEARSSVATAINSVFGAGAGDDLLNVDAANSQAFRAVSGKMLATELNKAKGPQTEGDAKRIADTLPQLTSEEDAKGFIINSLTAHNLRKADMADFYESYLENPENNGSLKGADRAWREFKRTTPMLSSTVKNRETGLPMFFYEFKEKAAESNPDASPDQIIEEWRTLTEGK